MCLRTSGIEAERKQTRGVVEKYEIQICYCFRKLAIVMVLNCVVILDRCLCCVVHPKGKVHTKGKLSNRHLCV